MMVGVLAMNLGAEPEAKNFTAKDGTEVLYRLVSPEKIEPGRVFPLVLFLHGSGERGSDNQAQLKHGVMAISEGAEKAGRGAYVIAPQCPEGQWWAEADAGWERLADAGGKNPLMDALVALVEETAKVLPVDRGRMYVTGLSMGGFGTFDLLVRSPGVWAAAMPICGGGDPRTVGKFKDVPVRIFHGDVDDAVAPEASRVMAEALQEAGADVELTMYAGVGHDSWTQTYADAGVMGWLFSQKKKE